MRKILVGSIVVVSAGLILGAAFLLPKRAFAQEAPETSAPAENAEIQGPDVNIFDSVSGAYDRIEAEGGFIGEEAPAAPEINPPETDIFDAVSGAYQREAAQGGFIGAEGSDSPDTMRPEVDAPFDPDPPTEVAPPPEIVTPEPDVDTGPEASEAELRDMEQQSEALPPPEAYEGVPDTDVEQPEALPERGDEPAEEPDPE